MIQYIIKALQKYESVCVNGLGTFSVHYESARFEGETLLPPQNTVTLDTNIDHDEIAFTNFVSRERQCLITQANSAITQWVDELKTALTNNKSIAFEDFGTFSIDNKGKLHFEGDFIPGLNEEFEGMPALSLDGIKTGAAVIQETEIQEQETENQETQPIVEPQPEPIIEPEIRPIVEPEPVAEPETIVELEKEQETVIEAEHEPEPEPINEPETESVSEPQPEPIVEESTNIKKPRSLWWLYILILLLVLGVLTYIFRNKLISTYEELKDKFCNKTEQVEEETTTDESTTDYEDETPMEEVVEEPQPYTPEVIKSTADNRYNYIPFETGHYYAIAGSFPNEKDVITHIKAKGLDQYNPTLVIQDGVPNIRICIGIFDSEEEAETYAKGINSNYWVLK